MRALRQDEQDLSASDIHPGGSAGIRAGATTVNRRP